MESLCQEDLHFLEAYHVARDLPPLPQVLRYAILLKIVFNWASTFDEDPTETLEEVENWQVRGNEPPPVTIGNPQLLGCAEAFASAWQALMPMICKRDRTSGETAEDSASETIGDLTIHLFAHWQTSQEPNDSVNFSEELSDHDGTCIDRAEHGVAAGCVGRSGPTHFADVGSTAMRKSFGTNPAKIRILRARIYCRGGLRTAKGEGQGGEE